MRSHVSGLCSYSGLNNVAPCGETTFCLSTYQLGIGSFPALDCLRSTALSIQGPVSPWTYEGCRGRTRPSLPLGFVLHGWVLSGRPSWIFTSFGYNLRNGISGSHGNLMFNFL